VVIIRSYIVEWGLQMKWGVVACLLSYLHPPNIQIRKERPHILRSFILG
jgi:hypothetical protein